MFPTNFCCGTLVLTKTADRALCREPQQDYRAVDLFVGIPILFGSASINHVCLPLLDFQHCLFKAGQPKSSDHDEARVIVKRVSANLSISVNGSELALTEHGRRLHKGDLITMHYDYVFLPFSKTSVFARYDFGKKMGSGACGQVSAVKDRLDNTICAAKAFAYNGEVDVQVKNSLATEYQALKAFSHERVVGGREAFREAGAVYIIIELALYGSLASYVHENGITKQILNEFDTAKVTKQMLSGLAYIHRQGFIHCDVKPGNTVIYSTNPWQIKICDFGLIVKRGRPYNSVVGTPPFIAPEVINQDSKPWDHRIDSYSLAITVMFLMSARYPYSLPDHICVAYPGDDTPRKEMIRWDIAATMLPGSLSQECQQFLLKMAAENFEERMEIQDGLLHPWVIKYAE